MLCISAAETVKGRPVATAMLWPRSTTAARASILMTMVSRVSVWAGSSRSGDGLEFRSWVGVGVVLRVVAAVGVLATVVEEVGASVLGLAVV